MLNFNHVSVLGVSGHRPSSLPGQYSEFASRALVDTASYVLNLYRPEKVISGMALGWDMAIAQCALEQGIDLIAAVPFKGQSQRWNAVDRARYEAILSRAHQTVVVSSGSYSPQAMQKRNQWMVNNCTQLLALWNQNQARSGTKNCVNYATAVGIKTFNCWNTFEHFYRLSCHMDT
ncbi:MAG: SLOG family protein [Cyanobacteria bacterium J06621_8]